MEKLLILGMGGSRPTTKSRTELHAYRTMRFDKRSGRLEEDGHGNHQKSDAT